MNDLARALLTLLVCAGPALAQEQYRGLPYPPNEMFEAMIGYAEDGGFQGLSASLEYIHPLSAALQREFDLDEEAAIRAAIAEGSPEKARLAVLGLIFLDLRLNLRKAAEAGERGKRAELVQMAFLDYGFLSPGLKAQDRPLDRAARADFRQMYHAPDAATVRSLAESLVGRLTPVFPPRSRHESP